MDCGLRFSFRIIALLGALALLLIGWAGGPQQDDYAKARSLYAEGKNKEVIDLCNQILKKDPKHSGVFNTRGCARHNLGDYKGALDDFHASIALSDSDPIVFANVGRSLRELKQFQEALDFFTDAIKRQPSQPSHLVERGYTWHKMGDSAKAIQDIEAALAIDPKLARGQGVYSEVLYDLGRFDESLKAADQAIALSPKTAEYHQRRASALRRLSRFDDALTSLDSCIKLGRDSGTIRNERGLILMGAKRYPEALKELETALKLLPGNGVILGNRGRCHALSGSDEAALKDYDASLAANPKDGLILRYRAELREKKGDTAGAKTDLEASLAVRPKDEVSLNLATKLGLKAPAVYESVKAAPFGLPTTGMAPPNRNPLDPAQEPKGDQLWLPSPLAKLSPPAIPPVQIPPALDFGALPPSLYSWSLTSAKEGMRAVMGPLTSEEEAKYEAKWAPYYECPTPEAIAYLNKLNPLLAKFLEARSGFTLCAQEVGRAVQETAILAESKLGGPAASALDAATYYKSLMEGYQAAMQAAVVEIEALGPMPNPFEARRKRAKRLEDELKRVAKKPTQTKESPTTGKNRYFVLSKIESSVSPAGNHKLTHAEGAVTATAFIGNDKEHVTVSGSAKWEPLPRVVPYSSEVGKHTVKLSAQADVAFKGLAEADITGFDLRRRHGVFISLGDSPQGEGQTWGSARGNGERASSSSTADIGRALYANVQGGGPYNTPKDGAGSFAYVVVSTSAGTVVYLYRYTLAELTGDQVAEIKAKAAKEQPGLKEEQDAALKEGDENAEKMARLAYLKESRRAFADEAAKLTSSISSAPEASRRELAMQIMYADAMAKSADDAINYAETGQWRRTRTLYDDYDLHRMMEISSQEARKASLPLRVIKAAEAQIQIAPEEMRASLRAKLNQALTPELIRSRDAARLKGIAQGIASEVSSYWTKQGEKEQFKATLYTVAEEGTKIGAGIVILGAGSIYVAGYGVSATTLWAADTLMGAAYGGVTGYVEGGPDQACRQSLQWAGLVGFAASEAIDAYGQQGTGIGAAIGAGRALALGKAFEYAGKFAGGLFKGKPTVQESFAIAKLQQELEWGAALIQRSQRAEKALAEAAAKNLKGPALAAAERELAEATAAVNGSYHAKLLLKYGADAESAQQFVKRVEDLYAKVQPEFLANLEKMGYDVSNLKFAPIRNASSAGSVGMDLDLALQEVKGMVIRKKDGTIVSTALFGDDAQKAYNQAYFAKTGYSAKQSLVNVTTSAHREAFTARLSQQKIPFDAITANDRARAAEVLLAKTHEVELAGMTKVVEAARATEKELRNRVLPDLTAQIAAAKAKGDSAVAAQLQQSVAYWEGIRVKLERASQCEKDAFKMWQALDEVKAITGGKDIFKLALDLGWFWKKTGG